MKTKLPILIIVLTGFAAITKAQSWKELTDSFAYFYKKDDYEKAIVVSEKSRLAAEKEFGSISNNYAISLNNLALVYVKMDNDTKAEPLYIEAMNIFRKVLGKEHPGYGISLNNLALMYKGMGNFVRAESLYVEAMNIFKKSLGEKHHDYATSLNNLASLYATMGNLSRAEPLFAEAMIIYREILGADHPSYAMNLNNLAGLHQIIGNYLRAESLYIEAMNIIKKVLGEEHSFYATSLNGLAVLYDNMGNYVKAEYLYIEAMNIFKKVFGEEHSSYALSLDNLASLYTNMGNYVKAESLYVDALSIRKRIFGIKHPDYAISLYNLAALYTNRGNYSDAERLTADVVNIRREALGTDHPDYAKGLNNLAILYTSISRFDKSEPLLLQNSNIVTRYIKSTFTGLSEKEKQTFLQNTITLSGTENSFLYKYPLAASQTVYAFAKNQLFFKGLVLDDSRNILSVLQQSGDTAVQQLYRNWQEQKSILAKQYSLPLDKRRSDIQSIETKAEETEKELNRRSTAFRSINEAMEVSLAQVQKQLKTDEVTIEFVSFRLFNKQWTDSTIYAAYILTSKDSIPVFVPLFEEKQLQKILDSAGKNATAMVSSLYRGLERSSRNTALGKELYNLIWQPLEPYLKSVKKINYSPAGKLYGIAFHALPVDSSFLLMDKYELNQYTSTRQVALRDKTVENKKPGSAALFGDARFTMDSTEIAKTKKGTGNSTGIYTPPNRGNRGGLWKSLPGTVEEVKKVKLLFEANKITTNSFTQTAASEENLKALSGNSPQVLHIATHGFFLPEADTKRKESPFSSDNTYTLAEDPLLRSGLILSGGNHAWSGKTPIDGVEDGIATAYEISQLNLSNTELVVLSACETALGDIKGSEGVFGLQRAFKMAGVKKMIVSLWQVPDKETAELMTIFYNYWLNGKTIEAAFAQAQSDMRKKYSPFYWAAFVLVE